MVPHTAPTKAFGLLITAANPSDSLPRTSVSEYVASAARKISRPSSPIGPRSTSAAK